MKTLLEYLSETSKFNNKKNYKCDGCSGTGVQYDETCFECGGTGYSHDHPANPYHKKHSLLKRLEDKKYSK